MGSRFSALSGRVRDFRRFLAHDLSNPSGYVVICLLGVLGLALCVVKL